MRLHILILGLLLFLPLLIAAQTKPGVLELFSTSRGGALNYVCAQGSYIYAAEGSSLVVYDTRDPIYRRAFENRFKGPITDMQFHNGFLFVANGHEGMSKWEIANPIRPTMVGKFELNDFETAIWSIAFKGDSLILAADQSVIILRELTGIGAAFEKVGEFADQTGHVGHIISGAVLGNMYLAAIVGREKGIGQGIHIFDIETGKRINFFHYDESLPLKIISNAAQSFAWVFGGNRSNKSSHLIGLSLIEPSQPIAISNDTIFDFGENEAFIGNGFLEESRLWIPCAGKMNEEFSKNFLLLREIGNADKEAQRFPLPGKPYGIWKSPNDQIHIACSEAGVQSFRFVKGQDTLQNIGQSRANGGFCLGADVKEDKLITAEGAAGMSLQLIQDRKIIATKSISRLGSIYNARFHSEPLTAICWLSMPEEGYKIAAVNLDNGNIISSLDGPFGHKNIVRWGDRMICARDDNKGFDILNCQNPKLLEKERSVLINLNDLSVDNLGHLFVSTEHNVRVFDLNNGFSDLATYAKYGEGFLSLSAWNGTVFVATRKSGIVKANLQKEGRKTVLMPELSWKMPHRNPEMMAIDESGIYLGYEDFGIYSLDKSTFETKGYYRTGLSYPGMTEAGLRDLFSNQGKIFIVEYYGQVTALRRNDLIE